MKIGILAVALLVVGCGKPYKVATASGPAIADSGGEPSITAVDGDGTPDGTDGQADHHLARAVIIHGRNLEGASVTLEQEGQAQALLTEAVEGGVKAYLPGNVKAGPARLHMKASATELSRDVMLLQGEAGEQGPAGPQGEAGPRGPAGEVGPAGPQGPSGPGGPAGAVGPMGPAGPKGDRGVAGERGFQGAQGPQGAKGDTGPQGIKGDKGDKGDKGAKGDTGDDGVLGTDLLVPGGDNLVPENGFEVIGGTRTVTLSDDAYLQIVASLRAISKDHVQPRDIVVGIQIDGDNHDSQTLQVEPGFDRITDLVFGLKVEKWFDTEGRITLLYKTTAKVKSGNVKIGLVARCGEAKSTDCADIYIRPGEQQILVTQLR